MRGTALWLFAAGCSDYGFGIRGDPKSPTPSTTGTTTRPTPIEADPDDPEDVGLLDGHFDVDTSAFLSAVASGTTDGHIHEYDDIYGVAGMDFLAPLHPELQAVPDLIEDPQLELVVLVINPDLSPDARLVLDGAYDPADPSTWTPVTDYGDTPVQDLPTFRIDELEALQVWFPADAIPRGGLVGSETACVRNNTLGPEGEWRNGALTLQVADASRVRVDGTLSVGGHGVAVEGFLWEGLLFWHWDGTCR